MTPHNLQIYIQALACVARVEGMKADNAARVASEDGPRWVYSDFDDMADQLDGLVQAVCLD
jgi:hypothetical protein